MQREEYTKIVKMIKILPLLPSKIAIHCESSVMYKRDYETGNVSHLFALLGSISWDWIVASVVQFHLHNNFSMWRILPSFTYISSHLTLQQPQLHYCLHFTDEVTETPRSWAPSQSPHIQGEPRTLSVNACSLHFSSVLSTGSNVLSASALVSFCVGEAEKKWLLENHWEWGPELEQWNNSQWPLSVHRHSFAWCLHPTVEIW